MAYASAIKAFGVCPTLFTSGHKLRHSISMDRAAFCSLRYFLTFCAILQRNFGNSAITEGVWTVRRNSSAKGAGVKTVYTTCLCNCGSTCQCVFKAHVKNGVAIAVEPDDRYNPGIGREDEVLSEHDLMKVRFQRRPCTRGLAFHKYIYSADRILYPLKRNPNSRRGDGLYERISWDEALSTIADKMTEIREKYGKYSIPIPYMPNTTASRLFSLWGAGVDSWGWCSYDAARLTAHIVAGEKGWDSASYASGSAADMLAHSKLIVIWGFDPAVGSCGPGYQFAWFLKLARERGKRVIIIDPRYTVAAAVPLSKGLFSRNSPKKSKTLPGIRERHPSILPHWAQSN